MLHRLIPFIVTTSVLTGCLIQPSAPVRPPQTLFTEVAATAGVQFVHVGNAPVMPLGTGVAWGDYDNDGWLDLYATNQGGPSALYHNQGDGTFAVAPPAAGVADTNRSWGVVTADFDRDGDLDLYITNLAQANTLYVNQGDGTFQDETAGRGLAADPAASTSAAVADLNGDGAPDLVVGNTGGQDNRLWRNDGTGHFSEATAGSGLNVASHSVALATADFNHDGSPDLYVVNNKLPDQLYLNNGLQSVGCQ